ncbi:MAG: zinc ribbon domain-containing protein [Lentisphaerales bacterium]|jgi:putative FmdB family regulatory protein|nr:MAG: zinc ribbon domain-containing protein [Lentisphaerales bacterium]
MPIFEYGVKDDAVGCSYCGAGFEILQRLSDEPLSACPECAAAVARRISAPSIGSSKTGFDDRAKNAGFHKFQKLGQGEYEKRY